MSSPSSPPAGSAAPRRRRPSVAWFLLVAFVVLPIVEIYVLIQVGQVIGAGWTVALLIGDSILGGWIIKREGGRAWRDLRSALQQGRMPATELADGALILIGGTLMLTPGFVTDAFGVVLILPFTRPLFRRVLSGALARHLLVSVRVPGAAGGFGTRPGAGPDPRTAQRPGPGPAGPVVQGEVVEE